MKLGDTATGLKRPQDPAMVARVKARMLAAMKAKSAAPKPKAATKPKASAPAKPTAAPVDPNLARAQTDVAITYGPAAKKLTDLIGQGNAHQSTIDRVYQTYTKAQQEAQGQHDATQAGIMAALQGTGAQAVQQGAQAASTLDAGAQAQNAVTGADTGQNAAVQQRIAQAIAQTGVASKIDQGQAALIGGADQGALSRLGLIAENQRGQFHERTQAYVNQLGQDQADLQTRQAQAALSQKAQYDDADAQADQQKITNLLAQQSLASKDKATQARYDAAIAAINGRTDVANANNTTDLAIATGHDATTKTVAQANREATAKQKEKDRQTKLEAAQITSGGKAGTSVTYINNTNGQTVTLTGAKRQEWSSKNQAYVAAAAKAKKLMSAHAADGKTREQLFKELAPKVAKASGVPLNVARAALMDAQSPGSLSGEYAAILKAYFPGGLVPGKLIANGGFKRA